MRENRPRRILHVIHTLHPGRGGPPQVCVAMAAAQASLGHDVSVLVGIATSPEVLLKEYGERLAKLRVAATDRSTQDLLRGRISDSDAAALRSADVVHAHGVWDPIIVAAARSPRPSKGIFVLRPAGMIDPWSLDQKRWKKRLALATTHRCLFRQRGFLQALTDVEVEHAKPFVSSQFPAVRIPNGVHVELITASRTEAGHLSAQIFDRLAGRPYVLFLSRLATKKGLPRLFDAFDLLAPKHPDLHLVVAGPSDGEELEVQKRRQASAHADRIIVPGPLYGADKHALMRSARCFCLPSDQEGFSVTVLEALAAGCPVVLTPGCHFPEIASAGAGCVVEPQPEQLAAAWTSFVADADHRDRVGAAARRLVGEQYTWSAVVDRLEKAYDGAIASGVRLSPSPKPST